MPAHATGAGPAIVCVDDELGVLRSEMEVLGLAGHRILIAQSADRALKMLRLVAVDALVQDYHTPGMDGLAFTLMVKRLDPAIPVIVFTSFPDRVPKGLHELAFRIVDKGGDVEILKAAVRDALAERRTFHGARAHLRYHVDLKVLVTMLPKRKPGVFWASAQSLGEGGLGAEVSVALATGDTVLLDLFLKEEYLSLPASVRYQTDAVHGFQFIGITPAQGQKIRQYCESLL
ncbi:MAG: response regulator [Acidobacteria bacterium]|nr:response regulator [Acidobacteriota bacterium]